MRRSSRTGFALAALVALAAIVLAARCASDTAEDEQGEPIEECCAFDSEIEVTVLDAGGAPIPGAAVEVTLLESGARWVDDTGVDGTAGFATGVLGTYAVAVTPPSGFGPAPGAALRDTVTTSRDSLNAGATFRLARAAP